MSDVFDEIISKLKQKAFPKYATEFKADKKLLVRLITTHDGEAFETLMENIKEQNKEPLVRLEDVKEAIQQIKQSHVIIPKKKLRGLLESFPHSNISIPYREEDRNSHDKYIGEIWEWHLKFEEFIEELLKE